MPDKGTWSLNTGGDRPFRCDNGPVMLIILTGGRVAAGSERWGIHDCGKRSADSANGRC